MIQRYKRSGSLKQNMTHLQASAASGRTNISVDETKDRLGPAQSITSPVSPSPCPDRWGSAPLLASHSSADFEHVQDIFLCFRALNESFSHVLSSLQRMQLTHSAPLLFHLVICIPYKKRKICFLATALIDVRNSRSLVSVNAFKGVTLKLLEEKWKAMCRLSVGRESLRGAKEMLQTFTLPARRRQTSAVHGERNRGGEELQVRTVTMIWGDIQRYTYI